MFVFPSGSTPPRAKGSDQVFPTPVTWPNWRQLQTYYYAGRRVSGLWSVERQVSRGGEERQVGRGGVGRQKSRESPRGRLRLRIGMTPTLRPSNCHVWNLSYAISSSFLAPTPLTSSLRHLHRIGPTVYFHFLKHLFTPSRRPLYQPYFYHIYHLPPTPSCISITHICQPSGRDF